MPKAKKINKSIPRDFPLEWPPISVKYDISRRVLETDQILLIDNFLTNAECSRFKKLIDCLSLDLTPPPKRGEAERLNERISIQSKSFAETLHTALEPHISDILSFQTHLKPPAVPSSFNQNIRLYRYTPGMRFGAHYDDSISFPKEKTWSEWTLLVYLTGVEDGVVGGETVFYKAGPKKNSTIEIVAPLKRGTALLHRHGRECMLHEGKEVTAGTKLVLRSDLLFSQPTI